MADLLLVDDDDAVRGILSRALRMDGHTVHEAPNGQEALTLLEMRSVDVVVSDVYMPEMDGLEFLRRVRAQQPDCRIILVTGGGIGSDGDVLATARDLGATDTLEKPIAPTALRDAVRAAIERG